MPIVGLIKRFRFEELARVIRHAFQRFPLATVFVFLLFILTVLHTHGVKILSDGQTGRLTLFLMQGIVFSAAAQIFSESKGLARGRKAALLLGGGALIALGAWGPEYTYPMSLYVTAALTLSLTFAPYIGRTATEDSVWYYNYLNVLTVVMGGISALVFSLGLCAALASVKYLFELHGISGNVYEDFWTAGWFFLLPIFVLAQWADKFDFEKQDCTYHKGIYFIANYLTVPLAFTYMFILYAYLGKIGLHWELPRGNLAYMVSGFGTLGILTCLAVYPIRETGTQPLREFYKYFFYILIVPIFLLALGIYTRVHQYGLTEERYALVIAWLWFAGLTALYTLRRVHAHIKHIPMLLCVFLLLASGGPWGAYSLSVSSQVGRLGGLLAQAGVIGKDGRVQKAPAQISFATRKSVSSVMDYLYNHHALGEIRAWTAPFQLKLKKNSAYGGFCAFDIVCDYGSYGSDNVKMIMKAWGIPYIYGSGFDGIATDFNAYLPVSSNGNLIKAAPYEYIMPLQSMYCTYGENTLQKFAYKEAGKTVQAATVTLANSDFTLRLQGGKKVVFALQPLADSLYKRNITAVPDDMSHVMVMRQSADGIKAMLRIRGLQGTLDKGHVRITHLSAVLLFTPPPPQ